MSVVILGGNECMERKYKDLCREYDCKVKIFARPIGSLKNKLGRPDLMIFFTSTMSHKMVKSAMCELKGQDIRIARVSSSSVSSLRNCLEQYARA
ncbi:MAG: DUF2325 domain-containing protein [Lachnospiraceae bacterium]|nr:DUF2325 domain-containing protein [Lachnospiraceae bacterium]